MTEMSKELFISLLAMDSYNRGYDPGLAGLSDNAQTSACYGYMFFSM